MSDGINVLVLTTAGQTGTGNKFANTLTGSSGNDTLIGAGENDTLVGGDGDDRLDGGTGVDSLTGGAGNDDYILDASGDRVVELAGSGTDRVQASFSHSLASASNVENLILLGSGNFTGTGNGLANMLTGNAGANALDGGIGSDTLTGGTGSDAFVFNTTLGTTNVDQIADFSMVDDTIHLAGTVFTGLGVGVLTAAAWKANATGEATASSDRILYNTTNGALYFDADGTGAGVRVQFATVAANLALTQADFLVI